jgi:hypothetical protein
VRIASLPLLLALLMGCTAAADPRPVDRIEMRLSGWTALDVDVNRRGEGHWHLSEPLPNGRTGAFRITAEQFSGLVERLAVYRREAVAVSEVSMREFINRPCHAGARHDTDQGGVWLRWTGAGSDEHYLADLGCDPERNAARNEDLIGIIRSLPVPLDGPH